LRQIDNILQAISQDTLFQLHLIAENCGAGEQSMFNYNVKTTCWGFNSIKDNEKRNNSRKLSSINQDGLFCLLLCLSEHLNYRHRIITRKCQGLLVVTGILTNIFV
jgi:hypothetical protein